MRIYFTIILVFISSVFVFGQKNELEQLKLKLEQLSVDVSGLSENLDITVNNVQLPDFLRAVANAHKLNLNISPDLGQYYITNNSSNALVSDVLVFVCKEYDLNIDFTGNIMSIRKNIKPVEIIPEKVIPVSYDNERDLLSVELKNENLYESFKQITETTGKNLVFEPSLSSLKLNGYIKNMPFDGAIEKLAFANNLKVTKTEDNYYLFEKNDEGGKIFTNENNQTRKQKPYKQRKNNFYFQIIDTIIPLIEIDFENIPISSVVYDISHELNLDVYTTFPLDEMGNATFKSNAIKLDDLLEKLFENSNFSFNKLNHIYIFGKKDQTSLKKSVIVPLQYRSIEIMTNQYSGERKSGRTYVSTSNSYSSSYLNSNSETYSSKQNSNTTQSNTSNTESLLSVLPQDVIKDLEIKSDIELNSFIVSGPALSIEKFKNFIAEIDKPIPVVSIEVMIIEVTKTSTLDTGVSLGIGSESVETSGNIYPNADLTLGASTINNILDNFNGFGSLNLGHVVPEFYASIKALESNGNIKIKSTPRLATLNGHRASLSIGETTYYAVTDKSYYGTQNPQTSEIKNYYPIDAELAIDLKPIISSDSQITLDISVIQSNFNGEKIDEEAPPGMNSREFTSIVRVKNEEMVVLGGLEEKVKNDSGSGVPLLARVPVIKWLFSKRVREDSKKKLIILIKPTIIY